MISQLTKIFSAKWYFNKPKRNKILIYDKKSEKISRLIFKKFDFTVLSVRFEEINFFVLLHTIYKYGLKNIKFNYKLSFINFVSPEIIFSDFTFNHSFFKLKNYCPNAKYICINRSITYDTFFNSYKEYYKNKYNPKLKSDFLFVMGENYKEKFSKYIDSKIVSIGSFKNNFYDNINQSTEKYILFISGAYARKEHEYTKWYKNEIENEIKIVKALSKYCEKNNYIFKISLKRDDQEDFFKKKYGPGKWTFISQFSQEKPYELINQSSLIVYCISTLGLEALIKGKKCMAFPHEEFPVSDHCTKFEKKGPFWSEEFSDEILNSYLDKISQYPQDQWQKIVKDNIGDLISYDPKNTKFYKILKENNVAVDHICN